LVRRIEVDDGTLVGSLFVSSSDPCPGVIALSGSEGGCPVHVARLLAEEGFACLALSYFHRPGLPRNLVEVPLDYLETAVRWLQDRAEVSGDRVGLLGVSKGSELALLSATRFPAVGAVVAYAPSSVVFAGISFGGDGRRRSSWSYHGTPLPFVPYDPRSRPAIRWRGFALAPMYRSALNNSDAVAAAAIPIEQTQASVLLLSGGRDSLWPSSEMADNLVARSAMSGGTDRVIHLRYDNAGHSFIPWMPDSRHKLFGRIANWLRLAGFGGMFELGGRRRGNRHALDDAWPRAVTFFADNLA
jgi:dienelactone hydrolase